MRWGYVKSQRLLTVYMGDLMEEIKAVIGGGGVKLEQKSAMLNVMTCLYADSAVLFVKSGKGNCIKL